jgi:hypothetical protein
VDKEEEGEWQMAIGTDRSRGGKGIVGWMNEWIKEVISLAI